METEVTIDPFHGPLCLIVDHRHIGDSIEEIVLFGLILDEGVDKEGVSLGMDVLHSYLKAIEAARLGDLHLHAELLGQVLQHDSVGGGKKCQDVFDEVLLIGLELLPVVEVLEEVHLVDRPERRQVLLVQIIN